MSGEEDQNLDLEKLQRKFSGEAEQAEELVLPQARTAEAPKDEAPAESVEVVEDIVTEPKLDPWGRSYGTGRRKSSIARVWIKPGKGEFVVNKRTIDDYFSREVLKMVVKHPFGVAGREGQFSVFCTVRGGGSSGQAGAIRHGVSRALVAFEPGLRAVVKKAGLLTRDAREVERKKYGKAKARKSFQFSKR